MPRPTDSHCSTCSEKFNPDAYPFCSYCGAMLVDIEDLDLSPDAPLDAIYRKTSIKFLN